MNSDVKGKYQFVFILQKFLGEDGEYSEALRMELAMHCGHTEPKDTINESIDELIIKLERLKNE